MQFWAGRQHTDGRAVGELQCRQPESGPATTKVVGGALTRASACGSPLRAAADETARQHRGKQQPHASFCGHARSCRTHDRSRQATPGARGSTEPRVPAGETREASTSARSRHCGCGPQRRAPCTSLRRPGTPQERSLPIPGVCQHRTCDVWPFMADLDDFRRGTPYRALAAQSAAVWGSHFSGAADSGSGAVNAAGS